MAKEIKFNIKLNVDGKEQLVTATTGIKEISEAANACRSRLGEMNNVLVHFNQKIEKYRNIADSISQVSQALASTARQSMAVTQLTGETGDAMRSLRSYYGKGFDEVLRSANALSKGFGIGMDEAMRLVRDGFASGADAGGDFLDTVREYPRYFKEAGLSAEDFIAISTNAARQGVFSDKGVDAIKEANIRLREMLNPPVDASLGVVHFEVEGRKLVGVMTNEPRNGPFHPPERPVWPAVTRRFTLRNGTGPQPVVCQQVAHKPSFGGTPRSSPRFSCPPGAPQQQIPGRTKMQRKDKNGLPLA